MNNNNNLNQNQMGNDVPSNINQQMMNHNNMFNVIPNEQLNTVNQNLNNLNISNQSFNQNSQMMNHSNQNSNHHMFNHNNQMINNQHHHHIPLNNQNNFMNVSNGFNQCNSMNFNHGINQSDLNLSTQLNNTNFLNQNHVFNQSHPNFPNHINHNLSNQNNLNHNSLNQIDNNTLGLILNIINQSNMNNQVNPNVTFNQSNPDLSNTNSSYNSNYLHNKQMNESNNKNFINQSSCNHQINHNNEINLNHQPNHNQIQQIDKKIEIQVQLPTPPLEVTSVSQSRTNSFQTVPISHPSISTTPQEPMSSSNDVTGFKEENGDEMEVDSLLDAEGSTDAELNDEYEGEYNHNIQLDQTYIVENPYSKKNLRFEDEQFNKGEILKSFNFNFLFNLQSTYTSFFSEFKENVESIRKLPVGEGDGDEFNLKGIIQILDFVY
jgi:hypothetical protein